MIPETLSTEMHINSIKMTSFIYKKFLFDFYPTDLVNTKTTILLRVSSWRSLHTSSLCVSVYIHQYSPPLQWVVVLYSPPSEWIVCELCVFPIFYRTIF